MQGGAAALAKWRGTLTVGKERRQIGMAVVTALRSIFDFGFLILDFWNSRLWVFDFGLEARDCQELCSILDF